MMALTYRLGLTESTWRKNKESMLHHFLTAQDFIIFRVKLSKTSPQETSEPTYVSIVVLFICPQDQQDKEQDAANNRQLQHGRHHPATAAAAQEQNQPLKTANRCLGCLHRRAHPLMATIGRQQQQQQGNGSGDTCCPARAANIRAFPPKKSVISPINLIKVME